MFYVYLYRMKEEKLNNPFLVAGYYSPAYFCDRETETEKIISALSNNRNVSLISPRRFGKTGLIHHVFYHLKAQRSEIYCFYVDIFSTQNLPDFVQLLAKTILGKLDNYSEKTLKRISGIFKSFRPAFSFDTFTGVPTITLDIRPEQVQGGLQEIFAYLQQSGKRCYIAIDEFQQITEYPEKGVEALLRSYIQFSDQVKFIFAGSKKHLMDAMFSSVNRPFYQSTQKIGLREIPLVTYSLFAENLFAQYGKHLDSLIFKTVYNTVLGHTWYIQFILNQLFSLLQDDYSESDVNKIVSDVLLEENATYKTYCELLTKGQLRLLIAIAKERKVNAPFQTSFLQKHHLTAASSVKLALKSLIDKTLILKDDEGNYFVYDRFFSLWLEETFK
ncbi:MAG: ATP-binding protein [Tannerellaceae bacterium]|jgi:AAA+ ATPase superfamily predicted ATPase|nr:ATP-binding protein [Tannerellaceae bacterium]